MAHPRVGARCEGTGRLGYIRGVTGLLTPGNALEEPFYPRHTLDEIRIDDAGADGVDGDVVFAQGDRHRLVHANDNGLAGRVMGPDEEAAGLAP